MSDEKTTAYSALEEEFDRFADEYEQTLAPHLAISGENTSFFADYKPAAMRRHLVKAGSGTFASKTILDFGCGVGTSLPHLHKYFPETSLLGADVSSRSLAVAAHRFPDMAKLIHFSGNEPLPVADASVDVSFSACVFHHVPQELHVRVLRDLRRIVKPGGWIFIFEHNPLNPFTTWIVKACPFDENAVLIRARELRQRMERAGFAHARTVFCLFFPSVLRGLRPLEEYLAWCPIGAQYYVAARRF